MKWASVLTGNRAHGVRLEAQVRAMSRRAHDLAGVAHGPARRCSWSAYSGRYSPSLEGGREAFEADMRRAGMAERGITAELETWDSFPDPVAILHVAEGTAPHHRDGLN